MVEMLLYLDKYILKYIIYIFKKQVREYAEYIFSMTVSENIQYKTHNKLIN